MHRYKRLTNRKILLFSVVQVCLLMIMVGALTLAVERNDGQTPKDIIPIEVYSTNMTLSKSVDLPTASPEDLLTYSIKFTNLGPNDALCIWLNDTLPANVTYISDTAANLSCFDSSWIDSQKLYYNFTNVSLGVKSFNITVETDLGLSDGTMLINWAFMNYTDDVGALMPMEADPAFTTIRTPNITVSKIVNKTNANPGDSLNYTIYFNNTGFVNATNVWVNETLPSNVQYINDSNVTEGGIWTGDHNWTFTNVAPGPHSFKINTSIDTGVANGTVLTNYVTCDYESAAMNTQDWANTTITAPNITLSKIVDKADASPGEFLNYRIYFNNTGSGNAGNLWINDTLPANVTFVADNAFSLPSYSGKWVDGNNLYYNFTSVVPGDYSFFIIAQVDSDVSDGSLLTNWAFMNYTATSGVLMPSSSDPATTTVTVLNITVSKIVDRMIADPGEFLNYTIYFNNTGSANATYVIVNDTLPSGVQYISDSNGTVGGIRIVNYEWKFIDVAPGPHSFQINVAIDNGVANGTVLTNYVTCDYEPDGLQTQDWANTTIIVPDEYPTSAVDQISPYWWNTNIWITATANDNDGTVTQTELFYRYSPDNISWSIWTSFGIDLAEPWSWDFDFPDSEGYYEFYSIATDDSSNVESAPASADSLCRYSPSAATITVSKVVDKVTAATGEFLNYTIYYNNTVAGTATNVVLTETFPPDTTFVSAIPSPDIGNNIWNIGNLAPGTGGMITIGLQIDSGVANGTLITNLVICEYDPGNLQTQDWANTTVIVVTNQPPTAVAKPDYQEAEVGESVIVYGNLSYDPDGSILGYLWDLGDGNSSSGISTIHNYTIPGNYTVTLTVTDNDGLTDMDTSVVSVVDTTPPVIFRVTITPPTPTKNDTIMIECNVTDNVEVAYVNITYLYNGTSWITFPMVNETFNVYRITIGPVNRNFTFHINATDTSGNIASYSGNVTVRMGQIDEIKQPFPWFIVIFGSIIGGSAALALTTEIGKFALLMLIIPLYTKLNKEIILDQETRGAIRGYIIAYPGDHYNSIMKSLNLSNGNFAYHVKVLENENIIKSKTDGIHKRFYPYEMNVSGIGRQLKESQQVIIEKIRENPGISKNELTSLLGLKPSTVNYRISTLLRNDLIIAKRKGMILRYYVVDELR